MAQVVEGPTTSPSVVPDAPPVGAAEPREPVPRRGWRYAEPGGRDLRLDLLRGFAVFAMAVDHLGGPSWLYALTGGNRFFVSAAEGFVFISGVVAGIVYGARARRDGLR
ncbi:MAG: OpgC domain-containing protein, partial [Chloroflexota bacterium]|nr:OpgC domain-containing protein [Chloroflexota bacterium]